MKILQQSLDKVIQTADIVEVVSDYVSLKRAGKDYKALCPFHNERTPSFTVIPSEQFYYCHGCKATGNVIGFVKEIESLNFVQSVEKIAQRYGIALEYEEKPTEQEKTLDTEKEAILAALRYAKDFYVKNLHQTDEGKSIALSYLKERGFLPETIQQFELGFSLENWDGLLKNATQIGISTEILLKANLISQSEHGKKFDRFRERIMFPIHNFMGEVVGFGARTLKNDKNIAKYLNSAEIAVKDEQGKIVYPIYIKSAILYGLYQAKKSIKHKDNCLLVEGYADVIALHQAGLSHAVASSGTSLTREQIQLIRRLTNQITLLYDGDAAGVKAALRGLEMILAAGLNLQLVLLPDKEDPDSYLKKYGGSQLEAYIHQNAKDFLGFIHDFYSQNPEKDFQQHSQMIRQIAQMLVIIPDEIVRQQYLQKAQRLFEQEAQFLTSEYNKLLLKKQDEAIRQIVQEALQIEYIYNVKNFLERKAQDLGIAEKMLFYRYKNAKIRYVAKVGLSKPTAERSTYYLNEATKFQALGIQVHVQEIQQSLDKIEPETTQTIKAEETLDAIGLQLITIARQGLAILDIAERDDFFTQQAQVFRLDKFFIEEEFEKLHQKVKQIILKAQPEKDSKRRTDFLQNEAKRLGIALSLLVEYFETAQPTAEQNAIPPTKEEEIKKPTLDDFWEIPTEKQQLKETSEFAQERQCLLYILTHGTDKIDEDKLVYEYILEEISDIQFLHPIYSQMIAMCRTKFLQGKVATSEYFLTQDNEEIKQTVMQILIPEYTLSERWATQFNVLPLQENKDWLQEAIFENILRIKLHKIEKIIGEQEKIIQEASEAEEQDNAMIQLMNLQKIQQQIAQALRTVIKPKH